VTEALDGIYAARVYSGSDLLGSFLVDLQDDTGSYDMADPAIAAGIGSLALDEIESVASGGGGGGDVTGFSDAALQQLEGVTIRLSQPWNGPQLPLRIVQGDDYSADDVRSITVTVTGLDAGLVLTGAEGDLSLKLGETLVTFEATDISRSGSDVVLTFEPDAEETAALTTASDSWRYDVQITLASGRKITPIAEAKAIVLASYTP
jgi:hypothetical protein